MADTFIGEVKIFAGNFAPRNWAFCDGQQLPIAQHTALFSILGTIYGGDGRTTFDLPDLRGRVPVGVGNSPGLSAVTLGQQFGVENVVLTTNQLPSHSHGTTVSVNAHNGTPTATTPGGNVWSGSSEGDIMYHSNSDTTMHANAVSVSVQNTGGGQAISTRPPGLGMHWIICLVGTYPSRT